MRLKIRCNRYCVKKNVFFFCHVNKATDAAQEPEVPDVDAARMGAHTASPDRGAAAHRLLRDETSATTADFLGVAGSTGAAILLLGEHEGRSQLRGPGGGRLGSRALRYYAVDAAGLADAQYYTAAFDAVDAARLADASPARVKAEEMFAQVPERRLTQSRRGGAERGVDVGGRAVEEEGRPVAFARAGGDGVFNVCGVGRGGGAVVPGPGAPRR
jgi:hypothetical protein